MDQMNLTEELNALLNEDLLAAAKGEGEPVRFTKEEYEKCREEYIKFSSEESDIEKEIREERARAAAKPDVYLTF